MSIASNLSFLENSAGVVTITNTSSSTSTTTGALIVSGGAGIAGALYVAGNIYQNGVQVGTGGSGGTKATTTSTAPSSPSVGDIWYSSLDDIVYRFELDGAGNTYWIDITSPVIANQNPSFGAQGTQGIQGVFGNVGVQGVQGTQGAISAQGIQGIGGTGTFVGGVVPFAIVITSSTAATSTSTGSLVVTGGVGIGGAVWIGTTSYINNAQIVTTATIGNYAAAGGSGSASSTGTTTTFYISGTGSNLIVSGFVQSPYQHIGPKTMAIYGAPLLTLVTTGTIFSLPTSSVIDPTGRFLYVSSSLTSGFYYYSINQTTGVLTQLGNIVASGTCVVDPFGRFVYLYNTSNITPYVITQSTGLLTAGTPVSTAYVRVAIDPTGRYLYGATTGGAVQAYSINQTTGALTVLGSQLTSIGTYPGGLFIDATGRFLYEFSQNFIGLYQIAPSGTLTFISTATTSDTGSAANSISGILTEPTGRYVYLGQQYSTPSTGTIWQYSINQITGALTTVSNSVTVPGGLFSSYFGIDSIGQNLYVGFSNPVANQVQPFAINQSTGALTTLSGVSLPGIQVGGGGLNGSGMAIDPQNRFMYIPNYQANVLYGYAINNNSLLSAGSVILSGTAQSTSTTTGALIVNGGIGAVGNIYTSSRVGWVNTLTNASGVYQYYNTASNSLDTIFG